MSAKYVRLANTLREMLLQNEKQTGYKLPSENSLCRQYHLSRQTVRLALQLLAQEGLIEKRQGSGSFSTGLGTMQNTIALILNQAEEYLSPALLSDIKSQLRSRGYSLLVYSTFYKISNERKILEELLSSPIRGLIVEGCKTALPNPNIDLYEQLRSKGTAILFINGAYPSYPESICVKDDNFYGGYLLGKHLIQNHHSHIAGIFKIDDLQGLERYQGLMASQRDFKIPFSDESILWFTSQELVMLEQKSDTSFLTAFLHRLREQYSAVVCHNDEIAYYLIREFSYAGIRVPEDISVVSFDNSYMSELGTPRITSLSHKAHELGTAAAQCLLDLIQGQPALSHELSWQLVSKGSDSPYTKEL